MNWMDQMNEFSYVAPFICQKSQNYVRDEFFELDFSYP